MKSLQQYIYESKHNGISLSFINFEKLVKQAEEMLSNKYSDVNQIHITTNDDENLFDIVDLKTAYKFLTKDNNVNFGECVLYYDDGENAGKTNRGVKLESNKLYLI